MPDDRSDKLDEVLEILRKHGAVLAAVAYCQVLFGHSRIEKLARDERDELTILIRHRILEASMATGEDLVSEDRPTTLQ